MSLAGAGALIPPWDLSGAQPDRCQHLTLPPLNYPDGQGAGAAPSSFTGHLKPSIKISALSAFCVGLMALTGVRIRADPPKEWFRLCQKS